MRRRRFIGLLGGAAAWPLAAGAQSRVKRIVVLGPAEEPRFTEIASGLKQGLRDRGLAQPALEIIEAKVARGDQAAASANVEIALRRSTAVLFAIGTELARAGAPGSLPSSRSYSSRPVTR